MPTTTNAVVAALFADLVDGTTSLGGPFILNTGDDGLLRSLDNLGPDEASRSVSGGATIAAHAQHVRFGLSLMNQWAAQGDNPFADPKWDEAWTTGEVDAIRWHEIRTGLQREAQRWLEVLNSPREVSEFELGGMIGSVAHVAYHLGAIRQIARQARGPRGGTFVRQG